MSNPSNLSYPLFLSLLKLEALGSAEIVESLSLAGTALKFQSDLLSDLRLLLENWFLLTTETLLLSVVSSSTSSGGTFLALLVLGDFVLTVLVALLAVGVLLFLHLHHF